MSTSESSHSSSTGACARRRRRGGGRKVQVFNDQSDRVMFSAEGYWTAPQPVAKDQIVRDRSVVVRPIGADEKSGVGWASIFPFSLRGAR